MIKLFNTATSELDAGRAKEIVKLGLLSEGDVVENFENLLAKRFNLKNVVAVNSGTSALHLALILAGVKPGDEVILPAQTFIATGLAILYCGAKPVFADIGSDGNLDFFKLHEKMTEKTKAIIAVDWAGYPADRFSVGQTKLIIDAAHSLGAIQANNKYVGEVDQPDFTCFSFQAIKHLTTGDGGAVVCKYDHYYERAKKLRWFGIDRKNDKSDETGERLYNLTEVGYKYHMNNVAASIGINQIYTIGQRIDRRRTIATVYNQELGDIPGLNIMEYDYGHSSYWLYPLLVENRNDFIRHLKEHDIESSVVHQGIDRNDIFGGIDESLVFQREFDKYQVNIPVHDKLTDDDVKHIIDVIRRGW